MTDQQNQSAAEAVPQAQDQPGSNGKNQAPPPGPERESPASPASVTGQWQALPPYARQGLYVLGLVAVAVVVWSISRMDRVTTPALAGIPASPALDEALSAQRDAQAVASSRRLEIVHLADSALSLASRLEAAIKTWGGLTSLEKSDEGKLIASNPEWVRSYSAMLSVPRSSAEDVMRYRKLIEDLARPARDSAPDSIYLPSDSVLQELNRHRGALQQDLATYEQHIAAVTAMLADAKRTNQPAAYTLAEAMARESNAAAIRHGELIAEKLSAAQQKAAEIKGQAEAERVVAQAEIDAKATRANAALQQQKADRERLRKMAEDPDIQALFKPFLTKGMHRLGTVRNSYPFPLPVSFSDMSNGYCLENTERFAACGSGHGFQNIYKGNDRPKWKYPSSEADWKEVARRLQLFVQLKDIWIEMGLLNK